MKKNIFLNIKYKGWQLIVPSSFNQVLVILFTERKQDFLVWFKFSDCMAGGCGYYAVLRAK